MKKLNRIIWGAVLVAAGVLAALNAFGITNFDFFFDGWWTLFIIVPCLIGLISSHEKTGNLIGLLVGVILLLYCQDVLTWQLIWQMVLPIVIVIIGLQLIFSGIFSGRSSKVRKERLADGAQIQSGFAAFSGKNIVVENGEIFEGAELNAVFGSLHCDLRNATINKDCVLDVSAIFGGIHIVLPSYVNVKISSHSVFGSINNKGHENAKENTITVYVNGGGIFGGVEIE